MYSDLTWTLTKRPGGILLCEVRSRPRRADQLLDGHAYARLYAAQLAAFVPFVRVDVVISSLGGAVDSALGMAKALLSCRRPVRILLDGACASAATIVAFSFRRPVSVTPGASISLHMPRIGGSTPRGFWWDKLAGMRRAEITRYMALLYGHAARRSRREMLSWMQTGKFLSAREALESGLAGEIISRSAWEARAE